MIVFNFRERLESSIIRTELKLSDSVFSTVYFCLKTITNLVIDYFAIVKNYKLQSHQLIDI